MPMDRLPPKAPPTAASAEDVREALVPVQMRVRGNQIVGLVDHMGNELGMPLTAIKSDGGVGHFTAGSVTGELAISVAGDGVTYDAAGRVATRKNGGRTWTLTYSTSGKLVSETDGTIVRTHTYDSAGRYTGFTEA